MQNSFPYRLVQMKARLYILLSLLVSVSVQITIEAAEPEDYIRIHQTPEGEIQLQVAVREFTPTDKSPKNAPTVSLVGVAHIGDKTYYQGIQTYLAGQDYVLFEGVGFYPTRKQRLKRKAGAGNFGKGAAKQSPQYKMAKSLGLTYQLMEIDYNQEHFYNSDLSLGEFMEYFQPGNENSLITGDPQKDREAKQFMAMMAGTSIVANAMQGILQFFGKSPKFQGVAKLVLIETLGQLGNEMSNPKNLPEEVSGLMRMIITKRNRVVLQDLKTFLREKEMDSISIFYGAAHMMDLEKKIIQNHGYKPNGNQWMTCFSVDPKKSGLSALDINFVRRLVQRQLKLFSN